MGDGQDCSFQNFSFTITLKLSGEKSTYSHMVGWQLAGSHTLSKEQLWTYGIATMTRRVRIVNIQTESSRRGLTNMIYLSWLFMQQNHDWHAIRGSLVGSPVNQYFSKPRPIILTKTFPPQFSTEHFPPKPFHQNNFHKNFLPNKNINNDKIH